MVDSEDLAHYWHTTRRVAEIKTLIEATEHLASKLEQKRVSCGTRPEHRPMVRLGDSWVLLDTNMQPIPDSEKDAAQLEARRADFFAVESPFNPAYWPESREKATETQNQMSAWRDDFSKLTQQLHDHCVLHGREKILALFPLMGDQSRSFPPKNAAQIVAALKRQVGLLVRELEVTDPREYLLSRIERDLPAVLKEARQRPPSDTRAAAAEQMGVSEDAVKSWEAKKRRPGGAKAGSLQKYVLKKFGLP